jgi:hypothetical protein
MTGLFPSGSQAAVPVIILAEAQSAKRTPAMSKTSRAGRRRGTPLGVRSRGQVPAAAHL